MNAEPDITSSLSSLAYSHPHFATLVYAAVKEIESLRAELATDQVTQIASLRTRIADLEKEVERLRGLVNTNFG